MMENQVKYIFELLLYANIVLKIFIGTNLVYR